MKDPANTDINEVPPGAASSGAGQDAAAESGRRQFTRGALIGSAVFLSLGNRASWAQAVPDECLSQATWDSYVTNGNTFASLQPGHGDRQATADNIAANLPPDTVSSPGNVCPGPPP